MVVDASKRCGAFPDTHTGATARFPNRTANALGTGFARAV